MSLLYTLGWFRTAIQFCDVPELILKRFQCSFHLLLLFIFLSGHLRELQSNNNPSWSWDWYLKQIGTCKISWMSYSAQRISHHKYTQQIIKTNGKNITTNDSLDRVGKSAHVVLLVNMQLSFSNNSATVIKWERETAQVSCGRTNDSFGVADYTYLIKRIEFDDKYWFKYFIPTLNKEKLTTNNNIESN